MFSYFLKNNLVNSALLAALLIVFRVILFFQEAPATSFEGGLIFQEWGDTFSKYSPIIATVLLLVQLVVILDISARYRISSESTLIPGLTFVVLSALIPEFRSFNPMLLGQTFVILALWALFSLSPRTSASKSIFNVGILVALAAICHWSYIFMLLAMLSGINILRSYRFNDLKILLLGFITPLFLIGTYYFYYDRWSDLVANILYDFGWPDWSWQQDYVTYFIGLVWVLIVATVVVQIDSILSKKIINKQNYFKIFYWLLVVSFLQVFVQDQLNIGHLSLLLIPTSFLMSEFLVNSTRAFSSALTNVLFFVALLFPFLPVILRSFGF